ncbi:MAG TPA: hypothetical protein VD846_04860 [Allosphingosinicella sp.]|nr:hypothetical protein [Allosphingosinicella sp.]
MKRIMLAPVLAALGYGTAATSQAPAPETGEAKAAIHDLRAAFVPLVALPLDTSQASDPIWASGERPAGNVIARLTLKPVEAATVDADVGQGAGKPLSLVRAIADDPVQYETLADLPRRKARIFCTAGAAIPAAGKRIFCLVDSDADGRFEGRAYGLAETGDKPEQLSILGATLPLPAPVPYRSAEPEEMKVAFTNCARDHDRPRYKLTLAPLDLSTMSGAKAEQLRSELHLYRLSSSACAVAEKVREDEPLHPGKLPKGAAVARLGELVIQVGPKDGGAPVKLLGLREPQRLYRLDRGQVLLLSDTMTQQQRALALGQKFDKPVVMTAGQIKAEEGPRGVGDVVLTAGLQHGYMGVLTRETKIRTLLSSRSLPAGTVLYGVPMSTRRVTTQYGVPVGGGFGNPGIADPDDVHLTWCVPVEEETKWTATCLPNQDGDRYTLLKGQTPAFEVKSFSYSANTTTNEGEVPVAIKAGDFGRPLSYRFRIKQITPVTVTLTRETVFGESVVSTRDETVLRLKGQTSGLLFSGGILSFADVEGAPEKLLVRVEEPFKLGEPTDIRSGVLDAEALRKKREASATAPGKGTR